MRRVNIATGIKQRLNEILGTQDESESDGILTSWSVQAAMLSNFSRILTALTGNSNVGRVLKGLEPTRNNGTSISISSGYGSTTSGDIVTLKVPLEYTIDQSQGDGIYYIYLVSNLVQCGEDSPGQIESSIINEPGFTQLVYDERGMSEGSGISAADIIYQGFNAAGSPDHDTSPGASFNRLYLGQVEISGGVISTDAGTIKLSPYRGFFPNTEDDISQIKKLRVIENLNVDGVIACGKINADDDIKVNNDYDGILMYNNVFGGWRRIRLGNDGNSLIFEDE